MKTLKEFDYDLWAIEENGQKRYFARVKATHEETEISLEVMRLLLSQEKQMRRELRAMPESGSVLSLDVPHNDEFTSFYFDNNRGVSDMETQVALSEFRLLLTEKQREVFESCLIDGMSATEYASLHGVAKQSVHDVIMSIRKKAKKFFSDT